MNIPLLPGFLLASVLLSLPAQARQANYASKATYDVSSGLYQVALNADAAISGVSLRNASLSSSFYFFSNYATTNNTPFTIDHGALSSINNFGYTLQTSFGAASGITSDAARPVCDFCGAFWGNRSITPGEREQALLISASGSASFGLSSGALAQLGTARSLSFAGNFSSISLQNLSYRVNGQTLPADYLTGQLTGYGGLPIAHQLDFYVNYTLDNLPELASQPFMPAVGATGFSFSGQVGRVQVGNELLAGGFYDPEVAVGYEYLASSAMTAFDKVMVPNVHGDGVYELQLWSDAMQSFEHARDFQAGEWIDLNNEAAALGLGTNRVTRFIVKGIEAGAGLDPTNPTAFVTGLTFEGQDADFTMKPLTTLVADTPLAPVPEPEAASLALASLGVVLALVRRRRAAASIAG